MLSQRTAGDLFHCKDQNKVRVEIYFIEKTKIRGATKRVGGGGGEGEASLSFFENQKKCPDFAKKGPDCVYP